MLELRSADSQTSVGAHAKIFRRCVTKKADIWTHLCLVGCQELKTKVNVFVSALNGQNEEKPAAKWQRSESHSFWTT